MSTELQLRGMHHVSALSAHIERSHAFYTQVLGLRPIIKSVNQDDPSMYHLFYGDGAGSPGSDMTIFDLPHASRERRGSGSVTRTSFRVGGPAALEYWAARLREHGVALQGIAQRDGRAVLDFDDPEGTQLALIDDGGAGAAQPWGHSPVPAAYQVRGLGYATITVPELAPTDRFLREGLGLRHSHSYALDDAPQQQAHVYTIGAEGAGAELHVAVRGDLARARYGAGGVHHIALNIPAGLPIAGWAAHLDALGYRNSGVVDRHYFMSLYVREPNHVLFELATEEPGFAVDGPIDSERLTLPPFLEPQRAAIEARLKPLQAVPAR